MDRATRWCRQHLDLLVTVALVVVSAVILFHLGMFGTLDALPVAVCTIAFVGLLPWRHRHPLAVAAAAGVLVAVPYFTSYAATVFNSALALPALVAVFLYAFALGTGCPWRQSLIGVIVLTAGVNLTETTFNPFDEMLTIGPWLAGLVVASRRRSVAQLELRTSELEAERGLFAVQSVRYERARIARELHDIVAHCVSLIVVQANAGEHLAHQDPDSAAEAFESISEAARQAEIEIDHLVELLDTTSTAVTPTGLRIVEELVHRVQASGLRVTCQFSGDSDAMCEQSAEAAYRLVQEGMTNAMKHAPGAAIRIAIRGQREYVEIEVCNESAARASSGLENTGGGHGLAGMRERVVRCGGTFDAGPAPDGGWQVVARLPRHPRQAATASPNMVLPWR
jgi:signal transduction histidine kinase